MMNEFHISKERKYCLKTKKEQNFTNKYKKKILEKRLSSSKVQESTMECSMEHYAKFLDYSRTNLGLFSIKIIVLSI